MTIKVFVDWRNEKIFTEEEYDKRVKEIAESLLTSDCDFSEFLEENYSHRELWEADGEQRAKIVELWSYKCFKNAYYELNFEEVELEV